MTYGAPPPDPGYVPQQQAGMPAPGTLSPDGYYRWDGSQWAPLYGPGTMPPPRKGKGMKIFIGCLLAAVLVVGGIFAAGYYFISNSPLSTFPTAPGAQQTSIHVSAVNGVTTEDRRWVAPGTLTSVEAYYEGGLGSTGEWVLASHPEGSSTWSFNHTKAPVGQGTITFTQSGSDVVIDVTFTH